MSNRRSILAAHKAISATGASSGISGGPSASGAWGSRASAMANHYGGSTNAGWAAAYGQPAPGLPRPPEIFTDGAFGPQNPILPVPINEPPPGSDFAEPRLFEQEVGWNLPVGQPGSEGIKLADFSTLKTLADLYSVARACIQLRKNEIRGIEWNILPTRDASKAMRGAPNLARSFGARRSEAVRFFKRPDPDFFNWASFLDALCEEVFVYDALSLLIRPKWSKGRGSGLLGSDLDSLALLSGPTIRPLLGLHGEKPRPPAPAYQQYLYGVPRVDLMTMITERDLEDGQMNGSELNQFRADQLLYLPMTPRRWTPYGFPPIERALIPVMAGLQKQGFQLDYFREGSVPAVYISPGGSNVNMTPNQIRELQDALNALAGDPAWKHKIIVLPADSKVMPQKQAQLADQFDEIVMNQVCMAFDVQPMELGIMPKVSTSVSPGAANQMSKASQGIHERKATKPFLSFVADIMNVILQEVCGQSDMRFVFEGLEEGEDESIKTQILIDQVGSALRSIDEAREELDLQPWGLPETSDPGWATATGWTPLTEAVAAQRTGMEEGAVFGGADPNAPGLGAPQSAGASADAGPSVANPALVDVPGSPTSPGSMEDASPTNGVEVPAPIGATPTPWEGTPEHEAAQAATGAPSTDVPLPTAAKGLQPEILKGNDHQERRAKRVEKASEKVDDQLTQLVDSIRDGKIDRNKGVALAVAFLTAGYKSVIAKAIEDCVDDHRLDGQNDLKVDSLAWKFGEDQRQWVDGLIQAALNNPDKKLKGRIELYSRTLEAVYNKSYADAIKGSGSEWRITWMLGPGENCSTCEALSGQEFTFDTLPGIPGSGGFGDDLCEGGPRCKCSLDYEEISHKDTSSKPFETGTPDKFDVSDLHQRVADIANSRAMKGARPITSAEVTDALITEVMGSKTRAILSELEAMARHAKKGRQISDWKPEHLTSDVMADIIGFMAKGSDVDSAVQEVRQRRVVDSAGQVFWRDLIGNWEPGQSPIGRGGGYEHRPHNADDMQFTPKGAKDLSDPNTVASEHMYNMLLSDFDPKGLKWVESAHWVGPVEIPLDLFDVDDIDEWAASHEPEKVAKFVKLLKKGKRVKPGICVRQEEGDTRVKVVDGHHRFLAYKELDKPFVTYLAFVSEDDDDWEQTHSYQYAKNDGSASASAQAKRPQSGEKVSKASVHYGPAESFEKRCGTCSMFLPSGSCTLVEGIIKAHDVCDEWEPMKATKALQPVEQQTVDSSGSHLGSAEHPVGPTAAPIDPTAVAAEGELMNNPELVQFFETGAGAAQIKWGTTGDISRCVTLATQTLGLENAQVFCQARYAKMTGLQSSGLIHETPS